MKVYGIAITKDGVDADFAQPKDYVFTTQFDTYKLKETATITLNIPAESLTTTVSDSASSEYEQAYEHGLDYVPVVSPSVRLLYIYDQPSPVNVNEIVNGGGYPPPGAFDVFPPNEGVYIGTDSTSVYLKVVRWSPFFYDPVTPANNVTNFDAKTVNVNVNIFYNRVDQQVDYL